MQSPVADFHEQSQGDTVAYTYDGADNLAAITYPDGTKVSYEYDLNDNLIKVTDREGFAITYVYDTINRITELVNVCDDCGTCVYTYEYDLMGNNSSALSAISRLGQ